MQNLGGQISCIMGDVQVANFYHLFAPLKYHVTLQACKGGGYREKGLMQEKFINQKNTFICPCYALLSNAFLHYWIAQF